MHLNVILNTETPLQLQCACAKLVVKQELQRVRPMNEQTFAFKTTLPSLSTKSESGLPKVNMERSGAVDFSSYQLVQGRFKSKSLLIHASNTLQFLLDN